MNYKKTVAPRAVLMASDPPNSTLADKILFQFKDPSGLPKAVMAFLKFKMGLTPSGGGILTFSIKVTLTIFKIVKFCISKIFHFNNSEGHF